MLKIRCGCFETNSSSTHAICIPKTGITCKGTRFYFYLGEYGWESSEYVDPVSYFYTYLADRYYDDTEFEEKCNQLKQLLLNNGADSVTFEDRKDKWYYIDHREELDTLFDEMLENIDLLLRFFNAEIITGNDNDDSRDHVEQKFSEYTENGYECYWKGN